MSKFSNHGLVFKRIYLKILIFYFPCKIGYDKILTKGLIMKSIIALALIIICTTCNIIAYWPQIVQLIKTKSADDINLYSWIIWITSEVSYLAYILLETPETGLILLQGSILLMSIIMFTLTKHYQKRKKQ